ncbi:MAG TPA: sulfatase-like hydrolase/transferase, partial [Thermoanaerobaculia bacterium]|nr:sulfatase-like hydrolase/transferase [Thermoanaerobaculia bacterium]
MNWRSFWTSILFLAFVACHRESSTPLSFPNAPVILISIDTLRADHLPLYGYANIQTPNLDALAHDGTVFENAWSHCPMTLPSHVSMLTGLLPIEHGVRNNLGYAYDATKTPSLPALLKTRGYATGAAVSSYVLRGETGLRNAFDWYEDSVDPRPGAAFSDYQRSGATTAALASKWISDAGTKPFFFFLHLYEPHVPYEPSYDGEIVKADAIVGEFLERLKKSGVYDKAIIVVTSDHGEGLGDHGEQQHSILLYTEAMHVPLIVKLPRGAKHPERVAAPASLADIAPTIASMLDVKMTAPHAANLFALPESRNIYGETIYPYVQLGWSDLRSLINTRFHYIDSPKPELYDLSNDGYEKNNIIANERRTASAMREELAKFPSAIAAPAPISDEDAARLASLGYVGSVRNRPDPRTLPNPVDNVAVLDEIQQAFELANQQRYEEAIPRLRAIVEKNPRLVDVWLKLAEAYVDLGHAQDAIAAYRAAIGGAGVFPADVAVMLGNVYLQSDDVADAEKAAEAALSGSPDKARALLVRIAVKKKNLPEAERLARMLPL